MNMELWYTENQTENVNFSMKVKNHLYSAESDFQKIDIIDTYEFGRVLVIDNWTMVTEKDEFIYHEMITHVALATNPNIKNVLVIGAGDGGTVRELTRYHNILNIDMVEDKIREMNEAEAAEAERLLLEEKAAEEAELAKYDTDYFADDTTEKSEDAAEETADEENAEETAEDESETVESDKEEEEK